MSEFPVTIPADDKIVPGSYYALLNDVRAKVVFDDYSWAAATGAFYDVFMTQATGNVFQRLETAFNSLVNAALANYQGSDEEREARANEARAVFATFMDNKRAATKPVPRQATRPAGPAKVQPSSTATTVKPAPSGKSKKPGILATIKGAASNARGSKS